MRIQTLRVGERPTGRWVPRVCEPGQESSARRGGRVDPEVSFLVRCSGCAVVFAICARCYAGQRLCGEACREAGKRAARRREQGSVEGAADHCDRNRAYRVRCRERERVMDVPPVNLAAEVSVAARDDGPVSKEDSARRVAESNDHGRAATGGSSGSDAVRDADRGDGGAGRDPSGSSRPDGPGAPARSGDVPRGARALAPQASDGCIVCGRRGQFFCVAPLHWSRRRPGPSLPGRRRAPRLRVPGRAPLGARSPLR